MSLELGFAMDEAFKKTGLTKDDLQCLRTPPLPGVPTAITDKQLILFINACDDTKTARQVLKLYYEIRNSSPELFNNRDIHSPEMQQCLEAQEYFPLPQTPEGHIVMFHRLHKPQPAEYNFENAVKMFLMTLDACFYTAGPASGIVFIFDMTGVSLGHLSRLRLGTLRKYFKFLQEAYPGRLQSIHVLNVVPFFDKIMVLIKPFMKKEILKMLHLYKATDMEQFFSVVPKSGVPSNFGGDLQSTQELHKTFWSDVTDIQRYFRQEEEQRKGSTKSNHQAPLEQHFGRLEID